MNPFKYTIDNKRYHTLNYYNRTVYGEKVYKAVIDCGFTCPNIDGTKGSGGCIFCDGGSGYFTNGSMSVKEQLIAEVERIHKKVPNAKIIAYFQANTNTYAPIKRLRECYEAALNFKDVTGISIGTRGDCLDNDIISLLKEINEKTNLTVELGLQTVHDKTIEMINRCCTHNEFLQGYKKLKEAGIRACLHIINGLPYENAEMMLETAEEAAKLNPDAVKIQMLHIIHGTKLEQIYIKENLEMLSKDDYIDIVVKQLEYFSPQTVIERITGDGDKSKLVAPKWSANKIAVLGGIDKRQVELESWQGKKYDTI